MVRLIAVPLCNSIATKKVIVLFFMGPNTQIVAEAFVKKYHN